LEEVEVNPPPPNHLVDGNTAVKAVILTVYDPVGRGFALHSIDEEGAVR
jgi:hypothetical protein